MWSTPSFEFDYLLIIMKGKWKKGKWKKGKWKKGKWKKGKWKKGKMEKWKVELDGEKSHDCFVSLAHEHPLFMVFCCVTSSRQKMEANKSAVVLHSLIFFQNLEEQHQQPLGMPVIALLPNRFHHKS
jgi:hypothetical protein